MTLLYTSPSFADHETGRHPEKPERIRRILKHLLDTGLDTKFEKPPIVPVSAQRLAYVHSPQYAAEVEEFGRRHGGYIEMDTVVSRDSYAVALNAAGAVCDAVEKVLGGEKRRACCLVRPPGHHALPNAPMGFCLFNSIAIGARVATKEFNLDRVLIVDWDVHHGNGTQDTFWEDPQVAFLSIHRYPFYPGTGDGDEVGAGRGKGTNRNLPVRFGISRKEYIEMFTRELEAFADAMRPQLVMISAGFDAHRLDPIGSLGLEVEDFVTLSKIVLRVAATHAQGRVVSVLEGGYNLDVLPQCVEVHLRELLGE